MSPLRNGSNTTNNLYVGTDPVQKIYRGGVEVWPGGVQSLGTFTLNQYTAIEPIDLSGLLAPGDRIYSTNLPKGLHCLTTNRRIIGTPEVSQSQTDSTVWILPAGGGSLYSASLTLTVNAPTGTARTAQNITELLAVPEFASNYSGPGAVITLTPGVTYNLSGYTSFNRCNGLTSTLVFIGDAANPPIFSGNTFSLNANTGTLGNVAFVNCDFHRNQVASSSNYGDNIISEGIFRVYNNSGVTEIVNISLIGCNFSSDVPAATSRTLPGEEVLGVMLNGVGSRLTVSSCTFTALFNGVSGLFSDMVVYDCDNYETWGDGVRASVANEFPNPEYVLLDHIILRDTVSDGLIRHGDVVQAGGQGGVAVKTLTGLEIRGCIAYDGNTASLPAIAPGFNNANATTTSTNTTVGATDDVLYRVRTDTAGANVTMTLPDISTVSTGWETCIQKYDDSQYGVVVMPDGSNTVNGAGSYTIAGNWKAVRFTKAGAAATNWTIEIYGKGLQGFLLQDDGGLGALTAPFVHSSILNISTFAGISLEVRGTGVVVEHISLIAPEPVDRDGDALVDRNDNVGIASSPEIAFRNNNASATATVRNSMASTIGANGAPLAIVTQENNDTGQSGNSATTISDRVIGGGKMPRSPQDAVTLAMHTPSGPLDGNGIGAVYRGPSDGPYDFINKRLNIPNGPAVTTRPVIALNGSVYEITTPAAFSAGSVTARVWRLDGVQVGTGSTINTSALSGSGRLTVDVEASDNGQTVVARSAPLNYGAAPDTTAPILSSAVAATNGSTAYTGSVATDEDNGTLYWLVNETATTPSAAAIKAGNSQAVSATGTQNVSGSGLTASTTYYIHYLHTDVAANDSAAVSTSSFVTAALSTAAFADAITDPANNSNDQRYSRTEVSRLGVLWMEATNQAIDTDFSLNMSVGNVATLEANGTFVVVVDYYIGGSVSGAGISTNLRTLGGASPFNHTPAWSASTKDWVSDPAALSNVSHAGFADVSTLYGGGTWDVVRMWFEVEITGTPTRVFYTSNSTNIYPDTRNFVVFDRATFDASDATMDTEITALT